MRIDEFDRPSFHTEILARLRDAEDSFVERKESCQPTKIRRTAVAFANSLADSKEGVIFVGVRDDGAPLPPGAFMAKPAEEKARQALGECYPKIPRVTYRSLRVGESEVLAIVIPASPRRPHFTGGAWVKNGASIEEASDEMLSEMIADRTEAARLLRPWLGQQIRVERQDEPAGRRRWSGQIGVYRLHSLDSVGLVLDAGGGAWITAAWAQVILQPMQQGQSPHIKIRLD